MKVCSICELAYDGYGNNAKPINEGRCCDECNTLVVLPARLRDMVRPTGDYTKWCRNHFNMLAEGGVWVVPRSGLTFTRRGKMLVLTSRQARHDQYPTLASWRAYQQRDFDSICAEFAKAGIEVKEATHDPETANDP